MKKKNLLFFSLILFVLTLSVVSAAENVEIDHNLTSDNAQEDLLEETVAEDVEITKENENSPLEGKFDDVDIDIYDEVYLDYNDDSFAFIFSDDYLDGSIDVKIDDKALCHKVINAKDKEYGIFLGLNDLKKIPDFGIHNINVTYHKNGYEKSYTSSKDVDFTYKLWIHYDDESDVIEDFYYDYRVPVEIQFPKDTDPKISVMINGKALKTTIKKGVGVATTYIEAKSLKIGTHTLVVKFTDKSKKYPNKTKEKSITILPRIYNPVVMSIGEKNTLDILATKGTKINATLYKSDKKTELTNISGTTKASIPLAKYLSEGKNKFYLTYDCDGLKKSEEIEVQCIKNSDKIKASVTKLYDSATVTIKGPKTSNPDAIIELDDEVVQNIGSFKKGTLKKVLSSLSKGKHKITVQCFGKLKYSKTFFVTVEAKDKISLSLKKVKVKKSARKLVLKATLKIDKKTKKGQKVTFKFNGKKFKAKTNSKGIAKVTIKKKILKKLKIGKKVKYQAIYKKKIVKKTAKVKW